MAELGSLPRRDLIDLARELGALRPEIMTRSELVREIERRQDREQQRRSRPPPTGWFGIARDLLASIVEQGLNLPDAAALIRGDTKLTEPPEAPAPVATVTLAQIYAAQGHPSKALATLRELLEREPDHEAALQLLKELQEKKPAPREAQGLQTPEWGRSGLKSSSEALRPASEVTPGAEDSAAQHSAAQHSASIDGASMEGASRPSAKGAPPSVAPGPVLFLVRKGQQDYDVYWELGTEARARAARRHGAGEAVIKLISITPGVQHSERREDVLAVQSAEGRERFRAETPQSVVRAALGWKVGDAFTALAVAATVASSEDGGEIVWQPRASYRPGEALGRALASG